jgi:hypothetical protein
VTIDQSKHIVVWGESRKVVMWGVYTTFSVNYEILSGTPIVGELFGQKFHFISNIYCHVLLQELSTRKVVMITPL